MDQVNSLRQRARKATRVGMRERPGWIKSKADLKRLLSVFSPLCLREGLVLRAYLFQEGGNGNGIVWAMPADSPFPEPDECPKLSNVFLEPPCPPGALNNVMEAIEGDGSLWSYLCASLFAREIAEFGAMWHGCDWSTHTILGIDPEYPSQPASKERRLDVPSREGWTWLAAKPTDWEPQVCEDDGVVAVTFYTYSVLGRDTIYRYTDAYQKGSYVFETEGQEIASGPRGYVF